MIIQFNVQVIGFVVFVYIVLCYVFLVIVGDCFGLFLQQCIDFLVCSGFFLVGVFVFYFLICFQIMDFLFCLVFVFLWFWCCFCLYYCCLLRCCGGVFLYLFIVFILKELL